MANFDHWMRLNIGDYLADTVHLNATQNGIYMALIMAYFKRPFLPHNVTILARISKVSARTWKRQSPPVLALFHIENGHLHHKRIDAERAEAERLSSRAHAKRTRARASPGGSLAGAPVTTATTTNPPPGPPPVIDLAARRKKGGGSGWTDVASEEAGE